MTQDPTKLMTKPGFPGPKALLKSEDNWQTEMGLSFPGERVVFRGHDLLEGLKDLSWIELLIFGITGRRFKENELKFFEGTWAVCGSYPDPRIWNNRVSSLASTAGSTAALAISSSVAITEANIYGGKPLIRCSDFMLSTMKLVEKGGQLDSIVNNYIKKYRSIPGFGRPIIRNDERVTAIRALISRLDLDQGKHVKLALSIEEHLISNRFRYQMNITGLLSSVVSDLGFSPNEFYQFTLLTFTAGHFPCFIEAQNKPMGTFLPLKCNRINYKGKAKRSW